MKKIISLIGAVFVGTVSIAQVGKTDTIKKPVARKVMPAELSKIKSDTSHNNSPGANQKIMGGSKSNKVFQKDKIYKTESGKTSNQVIKGNLK